MKVLIAEDDPETAEFVRKGLEELGHAGTVAMSGTDALHQATLDEWDVIVLDRMLPGMDGLSLLRRLRAAAIPTPVLLLTALGRIEDRVEGLESGADDYLVKPFAFSELAARLNALFRRGPAREVTTRLNWGCIEMDLLKREVRCGSKLALLQPREFELLEELLRNADRVVTRTMLLERVWGFHFDPQTNIVETHMSRLRSKLADVGASDAIETIRGVGYRMCPAA